MICYISPWHLTNSECLPFVCQQPQVRITLSSKLNRIGRWPFNHKVFNQRANRVCCSHLPPRSWKPELILKTVDSSGCLHLFMLSISSVSELLNFGFMGEPESASTVPMFLRGACFIQYDCHICLIRRCWSLGGRMSNPSAPWRQERGLWSLFTTVCFFQADSPRISPELRLKLMLLFFPPVHSGGDRTCIRSTISYWHVSVAHTTLQLTPYPLPQSQH